MSVSLVESAVQLPWLAPSSAALAALARSESSTHPAIANDPAAILLLLRVTADGSSALPTLDFSQSQLQSPRVGVLDRQHADARKVLRSGWRCATVARLLAERCAAAAPDRAWQAGLLVPLGWYALAAADPRSFAACKDRVVAGQPSAIARRLARRWHLPAWLSCIVGHLDLPVGTAPVAPADRNLFVLVQAAAALAGVDNDEFAISVGTRLAEALRMLGSDADDAAAIESDAGEILADEPTISTTGFDPYAEPLLLDLLKLARTNAQRLEQAAIAPLEREIDHLHGSLLQQRIGEETRLRERKLSALAEFAAGAGHEINNPLAVVSGQAQYLLASEAEPARQRSLQTIVQQAQRIHQILTELMQFARPARPQKRIADVRILARDAATTLHDVAVLRQVQIEVEEPDEACVAECDPKQLHAALVCLLRNAVEASAADGWARLRVETNGAEQLRFVVEDNGMGPAPAQIEHLFDPFYSGRPAGRGRGLGLPTAWRLAREQGGDVAYEASPNGPTRFVLTLPRVPAALMPQTPERLSA